jgi:hypothetical protein
MIQQTIIWGAFCFVALAAAVRWPRLCRVGLGVFFIIMALGVNVVYVLVAPDGFVKLGTDAPLLRPYEWIFAHVVSSAPTALGLAIAAFEIAVGVLMIRGGHMSTWGLLGGIAFLVVSSPLGPWTLPNLVLAAALAVILREQRRAQIAPPDRGRSATPVTP